MFTYLARNDRLNTWLGKGGGDRESVSLLSRLLSTSQQSTNNPRQHTVHLVCALGILVLMFCKLQMRATK